VRRLPENYVVLNFNGKEAYIRMDRLSQLGKVDAVIFDCDGVLVDIRGSYNRAISKTSAYIFEGLTGCAIPVSLISDEVIFLFRRSGGFNNDWDTVYGILMFMLCGLPEKLRGELKERIEKVRWQHNPFRRLSAIREAVKREFKPEGLSGKFFKRMIDELKKFAELLNATGTYSVDRNLVGIAGTSESFVEFYNVLKHFLYYPGDVGESIIATVFEEFFCGSKLFLETYRMEPKFYKGLGMVENEDVIIRHETLDHLTFVLGRANFGIASGSRLKPARYVLRDLLERFNPKASIFLDDTERAEREYSSKEGSKVNLKKPNPFSLLKAAEALNPFSFALYVGDSMEDAIMVWEARKVDPRFFFAGVYSYSSCEDALLHDFLKSKCDIVIPSVDELPLVLKQLGGSKNENS